MLVVRLVVFTVVDYSSGYRPHTKRAKKRCRAYFKIAHNCRRIRSEDHFLLTNFSAPHFVCSGYGTGYNQRFFNRQV